MSGEWSILESRAETDRNRESADFFSAEPVSGDRRFKQVKVYGKLCGLG
jgi:hypothetical protein